MKIKSPYLLLEGDSVQLYYDGRRHFHIVKAVYWDPIRMRYAVDFKDGTKLFYGKFEKVEVEG